MATNRIIQPDFHEAFTADGTANGIITLRTNLYVYPGAEGWIRSADPAVGSLLVRVVDKIGFTQVKVIEAARRYSGSVDISTWLVADNAFFDVQQQPVTFGSLDQFRHISDHRYAFMPKAGVRPAASADVQGFFWLERGAAGVADELQVCVKLADDSYAWVATLSPGLVGSIGQAFIDDTDSPYDASDVQTIICDSTAGVIDIQLPAIVAENSGKIVRVIKASADANDCTILPAGADTMDGVANVVLVAQYTNRTFEAVHIAGASFWNSIAGS